MEQAGTLVLMNAARINRSVKRMAHQIIEDNKEDKPIRMLGINERGYAVATALESSLSDLAPTHITCERVILEEGNQIQGLSPLDDGYVLLVDDVIFTGTTMFNTLTVISRKETLSEIHTATLIDRGHRTFPVTAQFVGMELPTKLNEHVSVRLAGHTLKEVILTQSV